MQHGKCLYFKLGALVVLVRRFELWTSSCGVLCTNQLQPLLLLVVAHLLVVCVAGLLCPTAASLFFFFLFLLRSARISCLSRTVRGGVSQGALLAQCRWPAVWAAWPRLVSAALCDLLEKGKRQWSASQKFAACKSESLTALTDPDCKSALTFAVHTRLE